MSLSARTTISIIGTGSKAYGIKPTTDPLEIFKQFSWPVSGTGVDAANQSYHLASTVLGISGSASLRFTTVGALLDAFGVAINWSVLKMLYVENTHATQAFTVSGTLLPLAGAAVPIGPGGCLCIVRPDLTGYVVGGATDTLTITNGPGSATSYLVAAMGVNVSV